MEPWSGDMNELPSEQWKYRIYMVAFPEHSLTGTSIFEKVKSVVPEARVIRHNIFNRSVDFNGPRSQEPALNESDDADRADLPQVDEASTDEGVEMDFAEPPVLEDSVATDLESPLLEATDRKSWDTASTTSIKKHDYSSRTWIENEALDLLDRVQKHNETENRGTESQMLLAGYGYGGVVIKQVCLGQSCVQIPSAHTLTSEGHYTGKHNPKILSCRLESRQIDILCHAPQLNRPTWVGRGSNQNAHINRHSPKPWRAVV
jgi:hypothetical protein